MTATITAASPLAQTKWADGTFKQHFSYNPFTSLMTDGGGMGKLAGAFVKENFEANAGASLVYNFVNELPTSAVVTGDTRVEGTGPDLPRGTDVVTLQLRRGESPIRNVTESQQRTKVNLVDQTGEALARQAGRYVGVQAVNALTDVTSGRTQNRYVYGTDESNYVTGANPTAGNTASLLNVDATDDKLSLALLSGVRTKMMTQSAGLGFMQPSQITTANGGFANKYVGLFHPRAIRDLKRDPDFRTDVYHKENPDFDVITGSTFVGEYEGILIYEMGPIDTQNDTLLVAGAGAGGIDVAHNLILGMGALSLGYGKVKPPVGSTKYRMESGGRMMFTTVDDDHGANALMAWTANMSFKKLVDNSSGTAEDWGTFHLFTSAASGLLAS